MVYIIAEMGIEHRGSMVIARQMIDIARDVGCNAIKTQHYQPELACNGNGALLKVLEKSKLTKVQLKELKDYCGERLDFLCSGFDLPSLKELAEIGLKTLKIPSSRNGETVFLGHAGQLFQEFILSTGMSSEREVDLALLVLKQHTELKNIALLHCVSAYPPPLEQVNLRAMERLKGKAGKIGISDHTLGTVVPVAAVVLGAQIIEKHFTLSRAMGGPDCKVSLEPLELFGLVKAIRETEKILGDGEKKVMPCERGTLYRKYGN